MDERNLNRNLMPRSREDMERRFGEFANASKNQRLRSIILDPLLNVADCPISVGELNYAMCGLIEAYASELGETRSFELLMRAYMRTIVSAMFENEADCEAILATFVGTPFEALPEPPAS